MHVAELLDRLSADADPQPELFDAAHATLRRLSGTDATAARVAAIVVHAELALLALSGHGVAVDACASCGGALPTAARSPFGMLDGGGLCDRCRRGRRAVISVSSGAMDALRRLSGPLPAAAELGPDLGGEVRAIMNAYLTHVLERPPGAGRWLPYQPPPRRRRSG